MTEADVTIPQSETTAAEHDQKLAFCIPVRIDMRLGLSCIHSKVSALVLMLLLLPAPARRTTCMGAVDPYANNSNNDL
jgi:hypothetical protein